MIKVFVDKTNGVITVQQGDIFMGLNDWMEDLNNRLSELETWQENHSPVSPFSDDKPSSNGQLVHEALNHINVPSPSIRIKPDDMVWAKWRDESKPRQVRFGVISLNSPQLEYISPILPEQRGDGWMVSDYEGGPTVWKWYPEFGKSLTVHAGHLNPGDLWQPIDPNHPDVPPMKPEGI